MMSSQPPSHSPPPSSKPSKTLAPKTPPSPSPQLQSHFSEKPQLEEPFYPSGAIAFFIGMVVLFVLIWLGLYKMMVHQQGV